MSRSLADEAADPKTTPQRMRELIQTDRSLYAVVACNPNIDEPLRQWLWINGGREVQEAMVSQYEEAVRAQKDAGDAQEGKAGKSEGAEKSSDKAESKAREAEQLAAERAEAEKEAREEAKRLEAARAEAGRLAAERKVVQALLESEKAENERLKEDAAHADEQRKMAAELAAMQAEAHAVVSKDTSGAAGAQGEDIDDDDDAESTVIVNKSTRPTTRLVTSGGQVFELTRDVVILGRRPRGFVGESVQVINVKDKDRTMSKTHARLSWHDEAWYISDLGSTNGVSVGIGNSKIELTGSEEVEVTSSFSLGLHDMRLEITE